MKIAALLLNRNLPTVTDKLYRSIKKNNKGIVDVFIIDAGSDKKNTAKNTTWKVNWKSVLLEAKVTPFKSNIFPLSGYKILILVLFRSESFPYLDFFRICK